MTKPPKIDRRTALVALSGAGIVASGLAVSRFSIARGEANVVVIGGGPAGATVAGDLKRLAPDLNVTLIEKNKRYTTCFFSNHYIVGERSFDSITHSYDGLRQRGVKVRHGTVREIDTKKKVVHFGVTLEEQYDLLVVAPGISISYESIEGYSKQASKVMPHAWQGGVQSKILRNRLEKMPDGGTVVLAPPKMPYRCPPGPYERACLIAHYLKINKPKSKLVILDAKLSFSKQPVFVEAFERYYKGIVDLHLSNDIDDFGVSRVDTRTGEVYTPAGLTVKADVANIIPRQTAGKIAIRTGLSEDNWCPIKPDSFRSTLFDDIYVLGDSSIAKAMPKSAFSAHSQAKTVVADILDRLEVKEAESVSLQNTCWSALAPNDSAIIGASYKPADVNGSEQLLADDPYVSKPGESAEIRQQNYEDSVAWYETLTREVYAPR